MCLFVPVARLRIHIYESKKLRASWLTGLEAAIGSRESQRRKQVWILALVPKSAVGRLSGQACCRRTWARQGLAADLPLQLSVSWGGVGAEGFSP